MSRRRILLLAGMALGAACRSERYASDGAAPDATADAPTACAAMIAGCVAALRALEASCAADGVACTTESNGSDQLNECYANGVRVYWDFVASDTTQATVLKTDGRTCYTVEHTQDPDGLIHDTVKDLVGARVLTKSYRLDWNHTLYVCNTGQADLPDLDLSCGGPINVVPLSNCIDGICERP